MKRADITIIGGGIAGLTTAIALKQQGVETTLFESAAEIGAVGAGITLAPNAMRALRRIGLEKEVIQCGYPLSAMDILDAQGASILRTNTSEVARRYGAHHYACHRADLHGLLLARLDPASITTGKRAVALDRKGDRITVRFHDGAEHETGAVILADGIHSTIRRQLLPDSTPRYAGYTCWRAVIDREADSPAAATETWGPAGRFGIVPLNSNRTYWFACINGPANDSRFKNFTVDDLLEHFGGYHAPIPAIIRQTSNEDLLWNDIIDLKPVAQFAFGKVVLIGDAAHATSPNLGQGACQAIEDAVILADLIAARTDCSIAFRQFEEKRLERTHWVVRRSRVIGQVAQLTNPWLGLLRNAMIRLTPERVAEQQLARLYDVDF